MTILYATDFMWTMSVKRREARLSFEHFPYLISFRVTKVPKKVTAVSTGSTILADLLMSGSLKFETKAFRLSRDPA